eukprot:gene34719-22103_t
MVLIYLALRRLRKRRVYVDTAQQGRVAIDVPEAETVGGLKARQRLTLHGAELSDAAPLRSLGAGGSAAAALQLSRRAPGR